MRVTWDLKPSGRSDCFAVFPLVLATHKLKYNRSTLRAYELTSSLCHIRIEFKATCKDDIELCGSNASNKIIFFFLENYTGTRAIFIF
jgi:hypothetical protein